MSDLCLMTAVSQVSNCLNSCGMLAVLEDVTTHAERRYEELQETSPMQACITLGACKAGVLEEPTFYKEEDQEGTLSLKDAPSLFAPNHTNNGMTGRDDKKLQYALRSNPKKSRRFLEPNHIASSSATAASSYNIISSITTAAYPGDMATASATPISSSASLPPPPPAAPVKKLNSIFFGKAHACTECSKQFSSWKALFGHMRCHPERQWRGIQPPSSISTKQKLTKQGKACFLISKAPQPIKEPQSENRGTQAPLNSDMGESETESIEAAFMNERDQGSPKAPWDGKFYLQALSCQRSPSPTESEVMDEHDMADCLVMLACAATAEVATEPSDCNSGQDKPGSAIDSRLYTIAAKSKKTKRSYSSMQKSIHPIQAKGEKALKHHENGTWEHQSKFECTTCKKQFRSHQALGGHRASHKKVKGCFARTNAPGNDSLPHIEETKAIPDEKEDEMIMDKQKEQPTNAAEKQTAEQDHAPEHCKMNTGRLLQCSVTCRGKTAVDKHDPAIKLESRQLQHQTSPCSSSSSWSVIAAKAAAGTLLMPPYHNHHHHHYHQLLSKIYQCTVCSRVFSTSQALEGHKRCHWGASPATHSNHTGTAPSQDSDWDCGEDAPPCTNNCISERNSELSRQGQQDSSSSASAEQFLVTDTALKQELVLNLHFLGDAKDGHASACDWSVEEGYALDLDATNKMMQKAQDDEGGSCNSHQAEHLHLELCSKIHATSNTGSPERLLPYRSEESSNFIMCHHSSSRAPFSERDASDSLEEKRQNERPPEDGGLLDLNLPAPVEATEEEEAGRAPHALRSLPDVTLPYHKNALFPFCHASCPCFTSSFATPAPPLKCSLLE